MTRAAVTAAVLLTIAVVLLRLRVVGWGRPIPGTEPSLGWRDLERVDAV